MATSRPRDKNLKILFLGHSYIRRAKAYREEHNLSTNKLAIRNLIFSTTYFWRGGCNYKEFNKENTRDQILKYSPDFIIVALAGNAVAKLSSEMSMIDAQAEMRKFHTWLFESFPNAKILPIECEPRFTPHTDLDRNHNPLTESFHARRISMNNALKRLGAKHGLIRLFTKLQDRKLFVKRERYPYTHLNDQGYEVYWELILGALDFNLVKWGYLPPQNQ